MIITVSITDDHPIILEGLEKMLGNCPQIELISAFKDDKSLLRGMVKKTPDVLLLDLHLPGTDTEQLIKTIKVSFPSVRILMLTNMDQVFTVRTMFHAGVDGYLLKGADKYSLIEAIEYVHEGKQYIDACLREGILLNALSPREEDFPILTQREMQILEMIAAEMTTRQISQKLFLSEKRIESLRTDLFVKLQVKNSIGLIKKAISLGLIK